MTILYTGLVMSLALNAWLIYRNHHHYKESQGWRKACVATEQLGSQYMNTNKLLEKQVESLTQTVEGLRSIKTKK